MPSSQFISTYIEGGREQWKADHDEAMACRELEAKLQTGLGYFWAIRLADMNWSRQVQTGHVGFDLATAREIYDLYRWWLEPCDGVLNNLDETGRDFNVEHAEEFRGCVREARRFAAIDPEAVAAGMADVVAGRLVRLAEGDE